MAKSRKRTPKRANQVRQKNRIRGLVGEYRKTILGKSEATKLRRSRAMLQRTLVEARGTLNIDEYTEFLNWTVNQTQLQIPAMRRLPAGYDYIAGIIEAKPASLEQEINWTVARLSVSVDSLRDFRAAVDNLERYLWSGNHAASVAAVAHLEQKFGQSLWLIELKLAFLQLFEGLESQKRYREEGVKSAAGRGLVSYFAHYFSMRNEPTVSVSRFEEDRRTAINASSAKTDFKAYLKYKLTRDWPISEAGLSAVLRLEQSHSNIDLYETLVGLIHHLISAGLRSHLRNCIENALMKLSPIGDYRLAKSLLFLRPSHHLINLNVGTLDANDCLLAGELEHALRLSLEELRNAPLDLRQVRTAAQVLAGAPRRRERKQAPSWSYVIERLSALYRKQEDFDRAFNEIQKLSTNLLPLGTGAALHAISRAEGAVNTDEQSALKRLASLNCSFLDPADLLLISGDEEQSFVRLLDAAYRHSLTVDFYGAVARTQLLPARLYEPVKLFGRALQHARNGDFQVAADTLNTISADTSPPLRVAASLLAINCNLKCGNGSAALDRIAEEYTTERTTRRVLPIDQTLGTKQWRDLKIHAKRLSLPIVIDLHWRDTNDDKIATLRRFAVQQFLQQNGLERPSYLPGRTSQVKLRIWGSGVRIPPSAPIKSGIYGNFWQFVVRPFLVWGRAGEAKGDR